MRGEWKMAKLELDDTKKMKYSSWIKDVRKKLNLTQEEFGQYIVHFVKSNKKCKIEDYAVFHRNSVANWEKGENHPIEVNSFLSLAVLEYDNIVMDNGNKKLRKPLSDEDYGDHESYLKLSLEERNKRYVHVKKRMREYLGMRLYTRNLNDALLIQVARGIYSFKELQQVRAYMKQIVDETTVTLEEKSQLATRIITQNIESDAMAVKSKKEFEHLVRNYSKFFQLGSRTVGERLKKICKEANFKNKDYDFRTAVYVYVPRCKDTYNNIFESDICISREWLLELCYKLRLTVDEINTVLESAGMYKTTRKEINQKYVLYRYGRMKKYSLSDKLSFAVLVAVYLKSHKSVNVMPPVDYMLDYFWDNEGYELLKNIQIELRKIYDIYLEEEDRSEKLVQILNGYFEQCENIWIGDECEVESKLYKEYRTEFSKYYNAPLRKRSKSTNNDALDVLYFMAALSYALFLGKAFDGKMHPGDMKELSNIFGSENSPFRGIYLFLENFLYTFLEDNQLHMREGNKFYMIINGMEKKSFSIETVLMDFYESWSIVADAQYEVDGDFE